MDAEEDLRQLFLSLAKEGKLDMADKFQTKTTLKATFCAKHGMDRESFGPAEHVYIRSSPLHILREKMPIMLGSTARTLVVEFGRGGLQATLQGQGEMMTRTMIREH